MASSSSDKSLARTVSKQTSIFDKDAFSRISEVQEAADRAWNGNTSSSFMSKGKFGRSALYSASSTTRTAYSTTTKTTSVSSKSASTKSTSQSVKTFTSKHSITRSSTEKTSAASTANAEVEENDDECNEIKKVEKRFELPSSSHHHIDASEFFKAKFPHDMDSDDFFRSASSRFTMRNLKSTSGWNVEFDDGGSLFPDFFPKNDAATKLSFESTWRAVSPTKEMGLAKQAIKNCSWEEEEKKARNKNNAKEIVNSWMQFFGHVSSVKDG